MLKLVWPFLSRYKRKGTYISSLVLERLAALLGSRGEIVSGLSFRF